VWIGTSVENQKYADLRLPILSALPARVRFISAEPLLGDFSIDGYNVDWVIVGGESGKDWRPLNLDHARSLRDQCQERGIPFFFKQHAAANPHKLGRELDGREWNQFPVAA
jgi:protein gp37